ncbi:MAG: putative hydroxyacylglutathione hydrolase [Cyanobacteria bacterium RYN_339]|nr:putative hydroxyacylglutathione hydrolase [Cyanobacteria bacterium RYN_339]
MFDVAIIGGGFAGTLTAVHLLRAGITNLALIERRPPVGRGVAYGTHSEQHLLNTPAGEMSAFADDPNHFVEWLGDSWWAHFAPRRRYGDYVAAMLAAAPGGWRGFDDEAVGLLPEDGGYRVRLRGGTIVRARRVVLAIGQFPPAPLKPMAGLEERPWYVDDPWSEAAVAPLPPGGQALLVGTGLSAVDVAISLLDDAGAGHVVMASRNGRLPMPQLTTAPYKDWFHPDTAPLRLSQLLRQFRAEVKRSGLDARAVLDAMRPHVPAIWQRLPWVERRRFLRHLRSRWEAVRNRLPQPTAARLAELRVGGFITIMAGRVASLADAPGGALVTLGDGRELAVARVINCTGPDMAYRRINHPLILDVVGTGLGRWEPLGLGLDVDEDYRLIDDDGATTPGLYAVGAPTKGRFWEVNGVAELRLHTRDLAARIKADL